MKLKNRQMKNLRRMQVFNKVITMRKTQRRITILLLALSLLGGFAFGGCKDETDSAAISSESGAVPVILEEKEDWKSLLPFDDSVELEDVEISVAAAKQYKPQLHNADKLPSDAAVEFSYLYLTTGEAQSAFPKEAGEYKIRATVYADGYLPKTFTANLTIRA